MDIIVIVKEMIAMVEEVKASTEAFKEDSDVSTSEKIVKVLKATLTILGLVAEIVTKIF